jgi:signal transduction histidine kinase
VLYRTILLISIAWLLVTGIILALLATTSWLGVQQLAPVSRHLSYYARLNSEQDALVELFIRQLNGNVIDAEAISRRADALQRLVQHKGVFSSESTALIDQAIAQLMMSARQDKDNESAQMVNVSLDKALGLIRQTLQREVSAHQAALDELAAYNDRQLLAAAILGLMIPSAGLAFLIFFRRRVLVPLNDLSYLMGLLARKDYTAAMIERVDPLMAPLFEKYNRMVKRMRDLDAGHAKREDALQQDVDQATRVLIQQQAALRRSERMAAVGDMSARLAHDLRNPLSGVLMALTNMRAEVDSSEQSERLGMAIMELERIARLFNNLVDDARQVPERPERLQLSRVIGDLIRLLRFQLEPQVNIVTEIPDDIHCRLPESGFRHVLLNLVLNAAEAMGEQAGSIRISAVRHNGQVQLSISDDGPGFPPELLVNGVYDFGSWHQSGAGLGLATARRFALEQGSRLELKNRQGGGACAILTLPVEDCAEA